MGSGPDRPPFERVQGAWIAQVDRERLGVASVLDWVKGQLGHSSIQLTVDVYGEWQRSAKKAVAKLLAGKSAVGARMAARTEPPLQVPETN
jgi:hypothetical protein